MILTLSSIWSSKQRYKQNKATAQAGVVGVTYVDLNVLQMQVCSDVFHLHTVINGDLREGKTTMKTLNVLCL